MKTLLLVLATMLMMTTVASADDIAIATDATGVNCHFSSGFNSSIYVLEKYSLGTTASRFRIEFSPGTTFLSFDTPYPSIGVIEIDMSVAYGQCLTGSVVIGTITANLSPGMMHVVTPVGSPSILYADCNFVEKPATGSPAYVDIANGACSDVVATEPSTWGRVKSLYR